MKKVNKLNIAEFVFAKQTDTLIVSEFQNCAKSLLDEEIINKEEHQELVDKLLSKSINDALAKIDEFLTRIDDKTGGDLMKQYYSGKL